MRIRHVRLAVLLFAAFVFAGLLFAAVMAGNLNVGELLLIAPKVADGRGIDKDTLAEVNYVDGNKPSKLMLTYEIASMESVRALNSGYSATVVKTNYTYPYVMGNSVIGGSFFTENDERQGRRVAALNRAAAHEIFGGYDVAGAEVVIGGDRFTVTGVVQNGDDGNSNIYVPASYYSDNPNSIFVRLDVAAGVTEEYVVNECKAISITDSRYDFISLSSISGFVSRIPLMGLKFAAICLLAVALYRLIMGFFRGVSDMKKISERFYLKDILMGRSKGAAGASAVRPVLILSALVASLALLLLLFPSIVEDFLLLEDLFGFLRTSYASFYSSDSASAIGAAVYTLQKLMLGSLILLSVFGLAATVLAAVSFPDRKHRKTDELVREHGA